MKGVLIFLLIVPVVIFSWAQTGSISGRVIDSKTLEPLPFTNVFINNTTIGTSTDNKGEFVLKTIPVGTFEIVYSFIGYQSFQSKVTIKEGAETKVAIRLIALEQKLAEVEIKSTRDKEWEKQLRRFEKIFLGDGELAKECKITNPYVIDFPSGDAKNFTATASAPIDILNKSMGYHITFYLKSFWSDGSQYTIAGNTKFEDLPAKNGGEAFQWTKNRENAYLGSARHFFKSVFEGRSEQEGFRLYTDKVSNTSPRLPYFFRDLEKEVSVMPYPLAESLSDGNTPYEKKIAVKNRLEIHYLNKRKTKEVYKDVSYAVSWLETKSGNVIFDKQGIPVNGRDLVFSGDMSGARVSEMLPLNYNSEHIVAIVQPAEIRVDKLYETVYLHTNKPFYYPEEIIWFKGYMQYKSRSAADSLSTVLYVDLINSDHQVIQSKTLRIDSGRVSGNIILPKTISTGNYILAAYTNWMRNYGEQPYFIRSLPVLNIYDRPLPAESNPEIKNTEEITLSIDKEQYSFRDQVKVIVSLFDENGNPVKGNLSISVTDVLQVPDVSWSKNDIRNELVIPSPSEMKIQDGLFKNRVEYGITWSGEFQSNLKKNEPTSLTVVRGNFEDVFKVTTAPNGKFSLLDLDISDSATFAFQALRDNKPYGKVKALPRDKPIIYFNTPNAIPLEHKESVQRNLSNYEIPDDAILLNSVEVKSTKLQYSESTNENVYGKGETTIHGEDILKFNSMQQLLQAKATGFKLLFENNHWRLRSTRLISPMGSLAPAEPILFMNNNQVMLGSGETVGDRLLSLIPGNIDRIEVSPQSNTYGYANSSFGLIAVFMKNGQTNSTFQNLYIKGYDSFINFRGPDYSTKIKEHDQKDLRSTLYWNNDLKIDSTGHGEFSFYTSDGPGQYRIVIEGMTEQGKTVHFEKRITVESK